MTFEVCAQGPDGLVFKDSPRREAALGVALDLIDENYSDVWIQDSASSQPYASQFLIGYAISRAQVRIEQERGGSEAAANCRTARG
jgi:hypothetical protein